MKYLVLMATDEGRWDTATTGQRQEVMDAHSAFHQAVAGRATMLAGEALARSAAGRTLRHVAGRALVTEGPYTDGVEQLGGFYLLDAESRDLAVDLCRLLPTSYAVEVRPVIEIEGHGRDRNWE